MRDSRTLLQLGAADEERTAARVRLRDYLDELVGRKLAEPGDDLISQLLERITDGELTRDEVVQMAVLMLIAGHETTANMIALGTFALLQHPDQLDLGRNARRHTAFGFGVHQCLGQPLARMELQVVYGTLYRCVPTLRLAVDPAELPLKHDGIVYGVHHLPVTW